MTTASKSAPLPKTPLSLTEAWEGRAVRALPLCFSLGGLSVASRRRRHFVSVYPLIPFLSLPAPARLFFFLFCGGRHVCKEDITPPRPPPPPQPKLPPSVPRAAQSLRPANRFPSLQCVGDVIKRPPLHLPPPPGILLIEAAIGLGPSQAPPLKVPLCVPSSH